eukprot:TRINITY_DN821_c0_g1_i2.p1 TRINITY_DN821_c0_g1~~TRINITY_DN821_c0_g1_i2.p1  ORF type:complete len:1689 (-),score=533.93 TRINITY_DN821_c0_g1_i2:184-5250(-)
MAFDASALERWYRDDELCSECGSSVVSLNGEHAGEVSEYWGGERRMHIYRVGKDAYDSMWEQSRNQAIVLLGQSGAGKSRNAHQLLSLFHQQPGASGKAQEVGELLRKSAQLLDSFGHAATEGNVDASRHGRAFKLFYSKSSRELSGCSVSPFLLERSRITSQPEGERNFHIFYQMQRFLEVASGPERDEYSRAWRLDGPFQYLQGGWAEPKTPDALEKETSAVAAVFTKEHQAEAMGSTMQALHALFEDDTIADAILNTTAGLLHLGQVNIQPDQYNEEYAVDLVEDESGMPADERIKIAAQLLQLDPDLLTSALTQNSVMIRGRKRDAQVNVEVARRNRDTMAILIYQTVFDKLVAGINQKLGGTGLDSSTHACLSVVDMFGFSQTHDGAAASFEQFCFNVCNEQLQERFVAVAIDSEKATLESELQESIDLGGWEGYDYQVLGITKGCAEPKKGSFASTYFEPDKNVLGLVDRVCSDLKSTLDAKQQDLVSDLRNLMESQQGKRRPLVDPVSIDASQGFRVQHYAGGVDYNLDRWAESNASHLQLSVEVDTCLRQSSDIHILGPAFGSTKSGSTNTFTANTFTLATQFSSQLSELSTLLRDSSPKFVYCIRVNSSPGNFDSALVSHQIEYSGLAQQMLLANSGPAVRIPQPEFVSKYVPGIIYHMASNQASGGFGVLDQPEIAQMSLQEAVHAFNQAEGVEHLKVGRTMVLGAAQETVARLQQFREAYQHRMRIDLQIWSANKTEGTRQLMRERILEHVRRKREQRLANAAASAKGGGGKPAATTCCLALVGEYDDVMDNSGSQEAFKAQFRADLARQLGIPVSRIKLTALSPGSIVVDFTIDGEDGDAIKERIRQLAEQQAQAIPGTDRFILGGYDVDGTQSIVAMQADPTALAHRVKYSEADSQLRDLVLKLEKRVFSRRDSCSGPMAPRLEKLEEHVLEHIGDQNDTLLSRAKLVEKAWRQQQAAIHEMPGEQAGGGDLKKKGQPGSHAQVNLSTMLFDLCANGSTGQIACFIRKHLAKHYNESPGEKLLPTDCLMIAIYSLQLENVNFLLHSGLVDPTVPGNVPLRPVGSVAHALPDFDPFEQETGLLTEVTVRFQGSADTFTASLNDTILLIKQRIHKLRADSGKQTVPLQAMLLTCDKQPMGDEQRLHDFCDANGCVIKLSKRPGQFSDDFVPFRKVPDYRRIGDDKLRTDEGMLPYDLVREMYRLSSKAQQKADIEACEFLLEWFKPDEHKQGFELMKPDMDLVVAKLALESENMFDDNRHVYEDFDDAIFELFETLDPDNDGRIKPEVLLELMEDLGHDYTLQELEPIIPIHDINLNVFRVLMTSIYMRALNRWCPVVDAVNLILDPSAVAQFKSDLHLKDPAQQHAEHKIEAVLLEIGIDTRTNDAKNHIAWVAADDSARVPGSPGKLPFGDFCLLATRLIVKSRGGACFRFYTACMYKLNACYESHTFLFFKYLLLVIFCILTLVCCFMACEERNTDGVSFMRMINNWETVPLIDATFKAAVDGVDPACDTGWEAAPSISWPGSSAGPCACPATSAYSSTTGACSSAQELGGCATVAGANAVSTVTTTSGIGTICFLRGGQPCATWINGAYDERPMLEATGSTCPSTHTRCGTGAYYCSPEDAANGVCAVTETNGMCQTSGITCPIRRLKVITGLANYDATYTCLLYTSPSPRDS